VIPVNTIRGRAFNGLGTVKLGLGIPKTAVRLIESNVQQCLNTSAAFTCGLLASAARQLLSRPKEARGVVRGMAACPLGRSLPRERPALPLRLAAAGKPTERRRRHTLSVQRPLQQSELGAARLHDDLSVTNSIVMGA